MSSPSVTARPRGAADPHAQYDKKKLFVLSVMALVTAGMNFALRGSAANDIRATFFDPIDPLRSAEMIGAVLGVAFLGFAFTIAIGSPLLDYLGMGRLLKLSSLCFTIGTLTVIFAGDLASGAGVYKVIWIGMVITGIGWGLVETVINPLTTTLYPEDKTHKLNVLHAWWPAGIIMGGLIGVAVGSMNLSWRVKLGMVLVPAMTTFALSLPAKFPPTERVASGVSFGQMFKELLRPFFLVWFLSMFLTAASELAPGQWVDLALTRTVGMQGIWLLIYVSGLMFVGRHFAGPIAHRLSPVGLLWTSCLLASAGLIALSMANSPITGLLAATLWGVGVCFMWPTMLAAASERFPRGGALLMGLMGTAGTLSIYFVLPMMGKIFDNAKIAAAGGEEAFKALQGPELERVLAIASQTSFRYVAALPAILLVVFGVIWLYDRARGGYRPERIH
ncbi:MAG TPA: MFS transporter [Bryobacteraceae bacterium]|nr:MFS transporter [Bryobacteraceae bacterium]